MIGTVRIATFGAPVSKWINVFAELSATAGDATAREATPTDKSAMTKIHFTTRHLAADQLRPSTHSASKIIALPLSYEPRETCPFRCFVRRT